METLQEKLRGTLEKAREIAVKAESAERDLTKDEQKSVRELLDAAKGFREEIEEKQGSDALKSALEEMGLGVTLDAPQPTQGLTKSLGEQWVESDNFKALVDGRISMKSGSWTSGVFDVKGAIHEFKTTLTEASGGASMVATPDVRPGILPLLFRRLTVADLMPSGTMNGNGLRYLVESAFTNAAATVAEGAAKPESALTFTSVTENLKKIAHFLPVTDELLEDVAAIRSYIDARLTLGVQLTEEDQLLNGDGTGTNVTGILARSGLATAQPRGTDSNADAIYKQISNIRNVSFLDPDAIVINPTNWTTVRLAKDANGAYFGGGPFSDTLIPNLWGLRVIVTPAIAAGTALVGAFGSAAQVFRKGGIAVEASNSHQDFFIKNLTAIRAEERVALAVYRPAGFGTVTGLN